MGNAGRDGLTRCSRNEFWESFGLFALLSRAGTWFGGQVGFRASFVLACFHMVARYLSHSPVKELDYCFLAALI